MELNAHDSSERAKFTDDDDDDDSEESFARLLWMRAKQTRCYGRQSSTEICLRTVIDDDDDDDDSLVVVVVVAPVVVAMLPTQFAMQPIAL